MSKFAQSIRLLPQALIPSAWVAGLLVAIVGFTGSMVLTFPAAENAQLSAAQLSSWVWAIAVGSGVATILLSLWYQQPVLTAWSTPALALLATDLAKYSLPEVVGTYLVVGLAIAVLGLTGLFDRLMALVPSPVALAVLGGILLKFGLGLFQSVESGPLIVGVMLLVFLLFKTLRWRTPMALALVAGFLVALVQGQVHWPALTPGLTAPVWIWPQFSVASLLGLGLPLLMLALASQNAPGFAVMRAFGYPPPVKGSLVGTGLISALTAPLLGHGLTLAAITAALGNSPEAHPNPQLRYGAGVTAGLFKLVAGLFGAAVVGVFLALPKALIAAMAGLALSGTIQQCLVGAFAEPRYREAALFTLLLTASDVHWLGLGAPFWGLLIGSLMARLLGGKA